MLDLGIGAGELILIAAIALIVVGPKDLPLLMRRVGQFTAKIRGLAAEFRSSFDEMARQSELDELRKEVDALRRGQGMELDGKVEMEQVFRDIDQGLTGQPTADLSLEYPEPATLPDADPPAAEAPPKPKRRPRAPKADAASAAEAPAPKPRRARKTGSA